MSLKNENIKYIICTIDDNYVQHFLVMLTSLFYNNSNSQFKVFVLTEGLSITNERLINDFFRKGDNLYSYLNVERSLLKNAPVFGHVSLATYYRILIERLIPVEVKKALFLDVDIIINGSIDVFWDVEITNNSHIAIENYGINEEKKDQLFLSPEDKYFNAGVMMVNLDWWRENKVYETANQFMINYPNKIEFWDQDVLNSILAGKWIELPYSYNAQEFIFKDAELLKLNQPEVLVAHYNPVIIHFTGSGDCKPWYYSCKHKYKDSYYDYLDKTTFKNFVPIGRPVSKLNKKNLSLRDKFYLLRRNLYKK